MRIGIDCRTILNPDASNQAGISHYTFFLVKTLLEVGAAHEWVLFFDESMRDKAKAFEDGNVEHVFVEPPKGRFFHHLQFTKIVRAQQCDVFHGPANMLPLRYKLPSVITIHDLAILRHPEWFPGGQDFSTKVLLPRSVKRAAKIIAVSKSTQKELRELFPRSKGKTHVVYEGVEPATKEVRARGWSGMRKKFGIGDDYILFVGTLEPRKNCVQLIEAFDELLERCEELRNYQLILAGGWGWKHDGIRRAVMNAAWGNNIKVLGYVDADVKQQLYQQAALFVYPSLWEGFGLPVLEAMANGAPVITSNVASLPEVGENAAEYVEPGDAQALSETIEHVLLSNRKRAAMIRKGVRQASKFSWEKCAISTLKVYEAVARKHRR